MIRIATAAAGLLAAVGLLTFAGAAQAQTRRPAHDYPTAARADYVIGCLASSGFKRENLERCSCGIDTIADIMPYEDYEQANTILGLQQGGLGERGAMFRDTPIAKERTEELRRAQAEVGLQCHWCGDADWGRAMPDGLYERDALAWADQQAALLRRIAAGERLNESVDWANVIEEV